MAGYFFWARRAWAIAALMSSAERPLLGVGVSIAIIQAG